MVDVYIYLTSPYKPKQENKRESREQLQECHSRVVNNFDLVPFPQDVTNESAYYSPRLMSIVLKAGIFLNYLRILLPLEYYELYLLMIEMHNYFLASIN